MTSPFGEHPPRPDNDQDEPDDFLIPPRWTPRERAGRDNFWSDEEASTRDSSTNTSDDVWSRDVAAASARTAAQDPADHTLLAPGPTAPFTYDGDNGEFASGDGAGAGRARRVAWELVQTLLLAALIFLMVRGVAQNFRVEGPSMEPGLHDGQYLLVNKAVYFKLDLDTLGKYLPFIDGGDNPSRFLFHGPERGDVVVFRYPRDPSRDFIKRIIGVPGDTVAITDGVVSVNGGILTEPYINGATNSSMEPKVVPEGSYFVMGDNRPNSSDSRNWGFVPEENIIGKAMFSYWPLSEFGGVGNRSIDLGFVKLPAFW